MNTRSMYTVRVRQHARVSESGGAAEGNIEERRKSGKASGLQGQAVVEDPFLL